MALSLSPLCALHSFQKCAQAPQSLKRGPLAFRARPQPLSRNPRKHAFLAVKLDSVMEKQEPLDKQEPLVDALDNSEDAARRHVSVTEGIPGAPSLASWNPLRTQNLATWRKRLFTSEDFIHLHAASTFFFLFSFFLVEGINISTIITSDDLWSPPTWWMTCPIAVSAMIGSVTGIQLAQQFRPNGAVRMVFVTTAWGNLISLWCNLGGTELYPDALRDPLAESVIGTTLLATVIASFIQYLTDIDEILKSRRLAKRNTYGIVAYIFPLVIAPIFLVLACKAAFVGSSEWASAYQALHPGYYEFLFHNGIIGTAAGSIAAFAVTLRDKQLIFPYAEVVLIYFASLSYIIFVVWCWNRYPEWLPEFIINAAFLFDPLPAVS